LRFVIISSYILSSITKSITLPLQLLMEKVALMETLNDDENTAGLLLRVQNTIFYYLCQG
jgi:hypothetical protein